MRQAGRARPAGRSSPGRDSHPTYTAAGAASIADTQPRAGRYEASLAYAAEQQVGAAGGACGIGLIPP